jgi:hypothetical protein
MSGMKSICASGKLAKNTPMVIAVAPSVLA